jgi:hypothetical protein
MIEMAEDRMSKCGKMDDTACLLDTISSIFIKSLVHANRDTNEIVPMHCLPVPDLKLRDARIYTWVIGGERSKCVDLCINENATASWDGRRLLALFVGRQSYSRHACTQKLRPDKPPQQHNRDAA